MAARPSDGEKERGPAAWLVVLALVGIPAAMGYLAAHWLTTRWVTPGCEQRCAERGSSLRSVTIGHKSGSPPSGCYCHDRATVVWHGPSRAGDLQMAVFIGSYLLLLAVPAAQAAIQRRRDTRARRDG